MSNQNDTIPTIQLPGTPSPVAPVAPPAAQNAPGGTLGPGTAPRRSRTQRKTKGMPGVPMAVGAVNAAVTAGAETVMLAGPEVGVAVGVAALAAGVYAIRSNARYKNGVRSGPAAAVRSMLPVGPRTNSGPGAGPRTSSGTDRTPRTGPGRSAPGPADQRTGSGRSGSGPGPHGRTGPTSGPRTGAGPRTSPGGPGSKSGGPRTRMDRTRRTKPLSKRLRSGTDKIVTAGRTAAKGWRKTGPARKFSKEQIKKLGKRILWPAVVAALTGLRKRSWKTAIEAWKNKRKKSSDKADTVDTDVKDTVRTPKNSGSTGDSLGRVSNTGGTPSMSAAAYVQATAEMMGAAAVYDPQSMMQVGTDLSQLPVAICNFAETIRIMTQRSNDNDPIHPAIIDMMGDIYKTLLNAGAKAEDLYPAFRNLHSVDIARLETPRKGEAKWDVSANR